MKANDFTCENKKTVRGFDRGQHKYAPTIHISQNGQARFS